MIARRQRERMMKGSYSLLEPPMRSCRERRLLVGTGAPTPGRLLLGSLSFLHLRSKVASAWAKPKSAEHEWQNHSSLWLWRDGRASLGFLVAPASLGQLASW